MIADRVARLFAEVSAAEVVELLREVRTGTVAWSMAKGIGFRLEAHGFAVRVDLEENYALCLMVDANVVAPDQRVHVRTDEFDGVTTLAVLVPTPAVGVPLWTALAERGL
ncbi:MULTISPECIES: hypothetical protein [unclassified Saccharothrix]|uniref:hypothetical protein n=1 Tax=unclassified Saccharothrix TaxID=2593673 RepID=UPI00307E153C